jgi:hypothetical protein
MFIYKIVYVDLLSELSNILRIHEGTPVERGIS